MDSAKQTAAAGFFLGGGVKRKKNVKVKCGRIRKGKQKGKCLAVLVDKRSGLNTARIKKDVLLFFLFFWGGGVISSISK